jgi:glutaminyl-tRNA synthetase
MDNTTERPDRDSPAEAPLDFIREIITEDFRTGKHVRVHTRFPPEPNGYLHIGHAKAISVNFGIAEDFPGACNLRFDDTNPIKEEQEFVDAIQRDIRWLGYEWDDRLYFASDYYETLYAWAEKLIVEGHAYVDDLTPEEIRDHRGTLTEPGRNSPWRDRDPRESLDIFRRMRAGEFPDGSRVLRAKIDMASPNINMRDPVLYRIMRAHHHRTGDAWCIYPLYDYAHPLSDAIEGITHSLCSLEFEDHRPLYDWVLKAAGVDPKPRQIEFARLKLGYTVMSKRKLLQLVRDGHVSGWDDPRMPTLSGYRRRGYPAEAIRSFCNRIGLAKRDSLVEIAQLEFSVREELNRTAHRVMGVLDPLKVIITNYPEGTEETFDADNNPEDASAGTRRIPFAREIYIEREDFMEDPPKKFFRLAPGREVRLKHAYFITCQKAVKDDAGQVVELHCSYDPATRGGDSPDGRKVKGTLHWVSARHALEAEVRVYDHLFRTENPDQGGDFLANLNPDSLQVVQGCRVEPSLAAAEPGDRFQFLRQGYFCVDSRDSRPDHLVFNRSISLKDSWARMTREPAKD